MSNQTNQTDQSDHNHYDEDFLKGLEWIWGEGFMSPGGAEEVAAILGGIDLTGKRVLDIGCGIAGIDMLLVQEHGAAHVTGIDVEDSLVQEGRARVARAALTPSITLQMVTPGKLPFEDQTFDVIFTKDSLIHIEDKAFIYNEIHRVLKDNGHLAMSDWFGSSQEASPEFEAWLKIVQLDFKMGTIEAAKDLVESIGFEIIDFQDRNSWYQKDIKNEIATMQGENYPKLVAAFGEAAAKQRLNSSLAKEVIVKQGHLRPGHIRARKLSNG